MKFTPTRTLLAAAAMAMAAGGAFAQEVTLRVHHFVSPKATVPARFIEPWARKVEADSNGRIKVEIFPGMQLGGKPPDLYDQIRDGVVDVAWAIPAYTPGRFPESEAFELPFVAGRSAEATSKAAWEFYEKYMKDRLGDIHPVAVHVHGPGLIHKKGGPVTGAADFNGLKLRGPSRQANKLLEAMGATPVGMPVPAFPEALSKGVVDGGVIPWEIVAPLKVHELTDSSTDVGGDRSLYNTFFVFGMNKGSYDKLPDDLKAVIDANSGLDASAWAGRAMDEGDAIVSKMVAGTDQEIYTMSDDARAEIKALGDKLVADWIAEMNGKGLDGQAMVDDARAFVAKYND